MFADPADQRRLLELVRSDAEIGRLTHSARTLPQHKQIEELVHKRTEASESLVAATTVLTDMETKLKRAEADLSPVKARLERDQQRIDDGSVTDSKTLRGLLDEVAHLKKRIRELEDLELDAMGELESAQQTHARIESDKATIEADLRAQVDQRDAQLAELKAKAKEISALRAEQARGISEELLALYEKVRASRGSGASELINGRCSGCQLEMSASDLSKVQKTPANQVVHCPECDRILVRPLTH